MESKDNQEAATVITVKKQELILLKPLLAIAI
jgi:hypothetical protein